MTATENLTHILIFRTNINTPADRDGVLRIMEAHPAIEEWSVDLDDIDRVLRVVSHSATPEQIINLINKAGYQCRELD